MSQPLMPNQRVSLNFLSNPLTDSRRFRTMTVVEDCTREWLALIADTSLSGARVAQELATPFGPCVKLTWSAVIKSFNGRRRDELLNQTLFLSRTMPASHLSSGD